MIALINRQLPLRTASTIFVIVFVVRLARMGSTASFTLSFPAATRDATATAAEWVSAKPAIAAAAMTPS